MQVAKKFDKDGHVVNAEGIVAADMLSIEPGIPPIFYSFTHPEAHATRTEGEAVDSRADAGTLLPTY